MNVFCLPPGSRITNVYLQNIIDEIVKHGFIVDPSFDGYPGFSHILKNRHAIYHFHWLTYLYYRKNSVTSWLRFLKLFLKVILIKLSGSRIVWTLHNYKPHEDTYPILNELAQNVFAVASDRILCHSIEGRDYLSKQYHRTKGVHILPHPHFIGSYKNTVSRQEARKKLGLGEDEFVFLSLGTIRPYRNLSMLINTFKQIKGDNLRLMIVGAAFDTQLIAELQECARPDSRISLVLREIPDDDIQFYFNAADIGIFTFTNMLNSSSVILSMSFKLPVIMPAYSQALTENNDFGFVYYTDRSPDLLSCMKQSISANLSKMGQNAFKTVQSYSWNDYARDLADIYLSLFK
ncbi:MAG: glycosyltransferase family 4 protein [Candidatus Auribacterota bacterium]